MTSLWLAARSSRPSALPDRARRSSTSAAGGCSRSSRSRRRVALHEFWLLARPLQPARARRLRRRRCSRSSARELGGVGWMVGGAMTTLRARVRAQGRSRRRARRRRRRSRATVMGAVWIGVRARRSCSSCATCPSTGGWRRSRCCSRSGPATRSPTSAGGCSAGTRWRRRPRPGKTWEGFVVRDGRDGLRRVRRALRAGLPRRSRESLVLGARARRRRAARRPVRVAAQARHAGVKDTRQPARRPRRHARPHRRAPLRRARRPTSHPRHPDAPSGCGRVRTVPERLDFGRGDASRRHTVAR